jgi:AmmeMemoRadiSam system protein B
MQRIRPPAVAGSFYPSDAGELNLILDECFTSSRLGPGRHASPNPNFLAGMVPHAGYVYSGACAAHLYAQLADGVKRIILIGVNHWSRGHRAALSPADAWQTPLGRVTVDQQFNAILEQRLPFLKNDDLAHAQEHSIEVQLPFLQRTLREFVLVPISLADVSQDECAELGTVLAQICESAAIPQSKSVILASSDLSHYLSPKKTDQIDRIVLETVLNRKATELLTKVEKENISMCGVRPAAVMLHAANQLGVKNARVLKHYHSGDVTPMRSVVGYAAVVLEAVTE